LKVKIKLLANKNTRSECTLGNTAEPYKIIFPPWTKTRITGNGIHLNIWQHTEILYWEEEEEEEEGWGWWSTQNGDLLCETSMYTTHPTLLHSLQVKTYIHAIYITVSMFNILYMWIGSNNSVI